MKVQINKWIRPRRPGIKDAVTIEHVIMHKYRGIIFIAIDTKEKWPKSSFSYGQGPGDHREISVHFGEDEGDTEHKSTFVNFIATTKAERNLFRNSYCTKVSGRYGLAFVITPNVPDKSEQIILYERNEN